MQNKLDWSETTRGSVSDSTEVNGLLCAEEQKVLDFKLDVNVF